MMEASRLVFLDESGLNTGMTRLYGRAKSTDRVVDYVPDVRYERVTILSSVRLDGTTVAATFNGALNGKIFIQYINQFLIPELKKGDVVIMDNLSSHKVSGVIEPIEKAGASVLFLPAYSPDLNPIELMWSKIKSFLRKVKARTKESLFEAIGDALNLVTQSDVLGWFKECGYYLQ